MLFQYCLKALLWPREKFVHEGEAVEPAPPEVVLQSMPHYGGSIVTSVVPSARTRVRTRHPLRTEKVSGVIGHLFLLRHGFERPRLDPGLFYLESLPPATETSTIKAAFVGQSLMSTPIPRHSDPSPGWRQC